MTNSADGVSTFHEVLTDELQDIAGRRRRHGLEPGADLRQHLAGLALSGGGVRSATFNLGLLQGLAALRLLRVFDYLSTVSGGGFVGGWWSAWLAREAAGIATDIFPPRELVEPERAPKYVERTSTDEPVDGALKRARSLVARPRVAEGSINAGQDPIHHLRLFANYITPRKGLLSADSWRAVAVGSRNLLLTLLILLPVLLAAVLLGQAYFALPVPWASPAEFLTRYPVPSPPAPASIAAPAAAVRDHETERARYREVLGRRLRHSAGPVIVLGVVAVLMVLAWLVAVQRPVTTVLGGEAWSFALVGALTTLAACAAALSGGLDALLPALGGPDTDQGLILSLSAAGVGLGAAVLVWLLVRFLMAGAVGSRRSGPVTSETPAPLADPWRQELLRNRILRVYTRVLSVLVLVAAALAIGGFGPDAVDYLFRDPRPAKTLADRVAQAGGWGAVLASAAGLIFTMFRTAPAGGGDTEARGKPALPARLVLAVTPPLVLVVLAAGLGWSAREALAHVMAAPSRRVPVLVFGGCLTVGAAFLLARYEWKATDRRWAMVLPLALLALVAPGLVGVVTDRPGGVFAALLALVAMTLGWVIALGWMVDPNVLSLHAFYKARLTRAYLGASNPRRAATSSEISDSVEGDDIALKDLRNCDRGAPYHLVNVTLNLAAGRDLATIQRSAAPFILSRRYCGSARTGYRETDRYMGGLLSLGTAVAISGAAASPNMGARTPTAALAALMTLLNVRLGYWAPTPNRGAWTSRQARLWPIYTLLELTSQTNDLFNYCYLTDGGHFDNLGLYSLVERGCRYIVVTDCGADPGRTFDDLGDAVRRCRIDFGTEIDIDISSLRIAAGGRDGELPRAKQRWVAGRIRYDEEHARSLGWTEVSEPARQGVLIVIKPSLTTERDEPADVRQYALQNPVFPQQPTGDQWFDEAQFESYRRLGEHSAVEVFGWLLATFRERRGPEADPVADAEMLLALAVEPTASGPPSPD